MELTTATAPRRHTWWRRVALLMAALVASLGTVAVVAPSPAQAATSITYCFPVYKKVHGWWIVDWICFEVPYAYEPHPCCIWDYAIDFGVNPVLPEDFEIDYLEQVGAGVSLLAQASLADPRTAEGLRAKAREAFLGAARVLGQSRVDLRQVGIADVEKLQLEPARLPWLESAATDIADGLAFMQRGLVREGMAEFEAAAAQLTAEQR